MSPRQLARLQDLCQPTCLRLTARAWLPERVVRRGLGSSLNESTAAGMGPRSGTKRNERRSGKRALPLVLSRHRPAGLWISGVVPVSGARDRYQQLRWGVACHGLGRAGPRSPGSVGRRGLASVFSPAPHSHMWGLPAPSAFRDTGWVVRHGTEAACHGRLRPALPARPWAAQVRPGPRGWAGVGHRRVTQEALPSAVRHLGLGCFPGVPGRNSAPPAGPTAPKGPGQKPDGLWRKRHKFPMSRSHEVLPRVSPSARDP